MGLVMADQILSPSRRRRLPFIAKYHHEVPITSVAVQELDLKELNLQTGLKSTKEAFVDYADNVLKGVRALSMVRTTSACGLLQRSLPQKLGDHSESRPSIWQYEVSCFVLVVSITDLGIFTA
ncbi:hypothetical protein J3458_000394 [Metarhizium acridum]|uniref:uncharacterized protein n=1 Tax=Metarhizium acridum TaxID=92637 RepID=UPI001C6CD078|nr:hypothetical protein J3458_000394 [Metarhizium acridum]